MPVFIVVICRLRSAGIPNLGRVEPVNRNGRSEVRTMKGAKRKTVFSIVFLFIMTLLAVSDGANANRAYADEDKQANWVITEFAGLKQELYLLEGGQRPKLEALTGQFPDYLDVKVLVTEKDRTATESDSEQMAEKEKQIRVVWECSDDYENLDQSEFNFYPIWEEEQITLGADVETPYITVRFEPEGAFDAKEPLVLSVEEGGKLSEQLLELSEEELGQHNGRLTIVLNGNTADTGDIVLPSDLGLEQVMLTSSDSADYKVGASPVRLFANGIPFILEHGTLGSLYGGGKDVSLTSTDITITGGVISGSPSADKGIVVGGSLLTKSGTNVSVLESCSITISGVNMSFNNLYGGCFTNSQGVRADIGSTNITIEDSALSVYMISGGSFIWSYGSGVELNLEKSNIWIENSEITCKTQFKDPTYAIYGGHIGNDDVKGKRLNLGESNITIAGSSIDGDIYGGHYDNVSAEEIGLDQVNIDIADSSVCGVIGGGYYDGAYNHTTGDISIRMEDCEIGESRMVGENMVMGGDIYFIDENTEESPLVDNVTITLLGEVSESYIQAEGISALFVSGQSGAIETPILPRQSQLIVHGDTIEALGDSIQVDSCWNHVRLIFDNGQEAVIEEYGSYSELIEQIKQAKQLGNLEESTGTVTGRVDMDSVKTPDIPDDVAMTQEEIEKEKASSIDSVMAAMQAAAQEKPTGLATAVTGMEGGWNPGDTASVFLEMQLLNVELKTETENHSASFVPAVILVEVAPHLQVMDSGGNPVGNKQKIGNHQLNGQLITFKVGIPPDVKASHADVVHYAGSGEERYRVEVEQGIGQKYVTLHASSFSEFQITFVEEESGDPQPPKPEEPEQPDNPPKPEDPEQPVNPPKPENPTRPVKPEQTEDEDSDEERGGRWLKNKNGWWYQENNNTWPYHTWRNIEGKWYYFTDSGYMATGWLWDSSLQSWFFLEGDGSMAMGWRQMNGRWYYMNTVPDGTRGAMFTGWHRIKGKWYYFETVPGSDQGTMYVNRLTPDGFKTGADGAWMNE